MQFCCQEHYMQYSAWKKKFSKSSTAGYVKAGVVSESEAERRLSLGRRFGVLPVTASRSALFRELGRILFSSAGEVSDFTVSGGDVVLVRKCKRCGTEFLTKDIRMQFCSNKCRYADRYE